MIQIKGNKRKVVASALTFCFFLQQSFCLQVLATNISGVTGNNGVYNIDPTATNGDIGFRKYLDFDVSQGDIANLIFHDQSGKDIKTFLNLVDNQINIQGIVNSLNKNGQFTDGHAVFISPNGMVVGASGVLNVGSLSVFTPDQNSYEKYKSDVLVPSLTKKYEERLGKGTAVVNIDGKIAARDFVKINAADVNIAPNALLMTGIKDESVINTKSQAEALFNKLVNTDNLNANGFANESGSIKIISYGQEGGTKIAGSLKNFAQGNIEITNQGSKGIDITGKMSNANGNTLLVNEDGTVNISGTVINQKGMLSVDNKGQGVLIASTGRLTNSEGDLLISNTGNDGINIENGALILNKTDGAYLTNSGKGGINVKGHVKANGISVVNNNSDVVIGYEKGKDYLTSSDNVNIVVNNGNVFNYGTKANLIKAKGNLDIKVNNGAIGKEVGPCNNGVCTGIGTDARDLTKSINTAIEGNVTAGSTGKDALVNIASLNTNLNVDKIESDGRVILLADSSRKGSKAYDIVNKASNKKEPNVKGTGISMIASGSIGEKDNALTFIQTNNKFGSINKNLNYKSNGGQGVDMLAINNINVKGLDNTDGSKNDTHVCAMIARTGDINAEFSGNTYIGEITANNNINITVRGKNVYIDKLGTVPTYPRDYYGPNGKINPNRVKVTALDLGTSWPDNPADSTIIIKNGKINADGNKRPSNDQDLLLVADNAYAGGYRFSLGKDRDNNGKSYVVVDPRTGKLESVDGKTKPSIRGKAVRPEDVTSIGREEEERNYYYGGSSQGSDPDYDGVNGSNDPDKQGTVEDDDNLVVPEDEGISDTDTDNDIDTDIDTDMDTDSDIDTDTDSDNDIDSDNDNDTDNDTDTDMDDEPEITDTDSDSDTDADNDVDNDTDTDADTDTDIDTDSDIDTDTDVDTDNDNDNDSDNDIDSDTDNDTDNDTDTDMDDEPEITDTDSDSDIDSDSDTDVDSDTDLDSDTDIDSDSDNDSDTDNDTDTDMDEPDITDTDSDSDTDADSDTDIDSDSDIDTDTDSDVDNDSDSDIDSDTDNDTDLDNDTDTDTDTDIDDEPDITDTDSDSDTDADTDTDADSDTDIDSDSDIDTDTDSDSDNDSDSDIDSDTDNDTDLDNDTDTDTDTDIDDDNNDVVTNNDEFMGKYTYKQRVVDNPINGIDKRQYMRFNTSNSETPISLAENAQIDSIVDISRGGVGVSHHNGLKVGDVVPVKISYGDLNIDTNVKIISATDRRAGAEFINLDQATKNKILYMNIMLEEQITANTNNNLSYVK